jgi:hypothetical protein
MVYGDGDSGAVNFENNFNPNEVYKQMVSDGVEEKMLIVDVGYGDETLYASIHTFEAVDPEFVSFMIDEFLDYDQLKAKNFYEVDM